LNLLAARLYSATHRGSVVIYEKMQPRCAPTNSPWFGVESVIRITEHDGRATKRKFCVNDPSFGAGYAKQLASAERSFVKVHRSIRAININVRHYGVSIALRSYCHVETSIEGQKP
jgi:hypothetical protein